MTLSTTQRGVLQLALDALDAHDRWCGYKADSPGDGIVNRARDALADALAQLESPPAHALYGPGGVSATQRERILKLAAEVYTEEGVQVWMNGRNKGLGNLSPEDMIAMGEGDRVEQLIAALVDGEYW